MRNSRKEKPFFQKPWWGTHPASAAPQIWRRKNIIFDRFAICKKVGFPKPPQSAPQEKNQRNRFFFLGAEIFGSQSKKSRCPEKNNRNLVARKNKNQFYRAVLFLGTELQFFDFGFVFSGHPVKPKRDEQKFNDHLEDLPWFVFAREPLSGFFFDRPFQTSAHGTKDFPFRDFLFRTNPRLWSFVGPGIARCIEVGEFPS